MDLLNVIFSSLAPCVPDDVTVVQLCEGNGAAVRWRNSYVATSFQLTASGRDGHVASCNTLVNNCTLANLHCGQPYNVSITASGDNCTSKPNTTSFTTGRRVIILISFSFCIWRMISDTGFSLSFLSVPCEPSSLNVETDCETNTAFMSWITSESAMKFYGQAQSINGSVLYCNSNVSSCTFESLKCGDVLNFSVLASNGICNTSLSPPLTAGAGKY